VRVQRIRYVDGARRLVDAGGDGTHRTDDRGIYRIYGLAPDEYIVSATVGQLARKRVQGAFVLEPMTELAGYATSYHPGTATPAEAQRVPVNLSQDVPGIDIMLMRAPTARITGTIVDSSGKPVRDGLILTPSRRSGVLATSPVGAEIDSAGRFEFRNVAPGEYVIQASGGFRNAYDEGETASQFVTVSGTDVTGLEIRLTRGSEIAGRLTFESSSAPETLFGFDIQAVPVDMDRTPQNLESGAASAFIEADGTFKVAGVTGARVFRLMQAQPGWALKAVLLDGEDITDAPIVLDATLTSLDGLEVVLTDRISNVSGRAVDARGRPVSDATIVVYSMDRAHWGEGSRFLATARSARDGTFAVRHLPPGEYRAAAVAQLGPD
jgi:protocatechuate 3,4-dioxygenase beta subunit